MTKIADGQEPTGALSPLTSAQVHGSMPRLDRFRHHEPDLAVFTFLLVGAANCLETLVRG
jgi:hypothetical protein